MARYTRTLALFVLLSVLAGAGPASRPEVDIQNATDFQSGLVHHAIELFGRAGMLLPPVHLSFGPESSECGHGNDGRIRADGARYRIWVCSSADDPTVRQWHAIVHELAHAWEFSTLTDSTRTAFMRLRGADDWSSDSVEWWERGSEQAAEIIAWGVSDRPITTWIFHNSCPEMSVAFRLLTGEEPALGKAHSCR